jgi:hypothetical protein
MSSQQFTWVVVVNAPKLDLPLITFSQAVHDHFVASGVVASPNPTMPVFQADITAYLMAQTATKGGGKAATALRNAKRKTVKDDLRHLRDGVQGVVDLQTSLSAAQAAAESAFMSIKKAMTRNTPAFAAKNTGLPGIVELTAKAAAASATYYWEYSVDQVNWSSAPETMKHVTVISGLTSAKVYYFRFRALTRKAMGSWSQVVSLLVQ